jgi:hypothetical protein
MANELSLLPNPDNVPGAVSTGYQRQNTNIFAIQTGLDTTDPFDNGTAITIPVGGLVEINGSIFKVIADVSLSKPSPDSAYWVAVTANGTSTASFSLVTRPGVWNSSKQGYYLTNGARTLNWCSLGTLSGSLPSATYSKTTKGIATTSLPKGWYYFLVRSGNGGAPGGAGGNASDNTPGTGGAGGNAYVFYEKQKLVFFDKQQNITIKIGGSGFNGGTGGKGNDRNPSKPAGGGGGGGGSGCGEESSVPELSIFTGEVPGGNGGNGGNGIGQYVDDYGGGGGGGYYLGGTGGINSTDSKKNGGQNGFNLFNLIDYIYLSKGGNGGYNNSTLNNGGERGIRGPGENGKTDSFLVQASAAGGGGGGMGGHGRERPDGSTEAGSCYIYRLDN